MKVFSGEVVDVIFDKSEALRASVAEKKLYCCQNVSRANKYSVIKG